MSEHINEKIDEGSNLIAEFQDYTSCSDNKGACCVRAISAILHFAASFGADPETVSQKALNLFFIESDQNQ